MGEDRQLKSWNIPWKNSRKQAENGPLRILCVFYGYFTVILWFRYPVQHLELSAYEGTKKVRETSDMVRGVANGEHEGREDKNTHEIGW